MSWPVTPDNLIDGGKESRLNCQFFQHAVNKASEQTETEAPVSTKKSTSLLATYPVNLGLLFPWLLWVNEHMDPNDMEATHI